MNESKTTTKEKMVVVGVRVPLHLKRIMQQYIILDAHKDISELTRDAIRQKIQHDAPALYAQLFQESTT